MRIRYTDKDPRRGQIVEINDDVAEGLIEAGTAEEAGEDERSEPTEGMEGYDPNAQTDDDGVKEGTGGTENKSGDDEGRTPRKSAKTTAKKTGRR